MRGDERVLGRGCGALLAGLWLAGPGGGGEPRPTAQEMPAAKREVWAEAALRQPGGPSYEFFRGLLPPLRYVDTSFRHYPIVLSAPGSVGKARLVSNGSALNALARQPNWRGEAGVPVAFRVGLEGEPFG